MHGAHEHPARDGTLTTGPASGGQLGAGALSEDGVPDLAEEATGGIPIEDVRLEVLPPAPLLELDLAFLQRALTTNTPVPADCDAATAPPPVP